MKYRSKPTIVEAEQFWPDKPLPFHERGPIVAYEAGRWYVTTAQGLAVGVRPGDFVVLEPREVRGDRFYAYPVRADIFHAKYEAIPDPMGVYEREEA